MDWDVLIPILMFLFPLVVSILDKQAKKRKSVPPVKAEPLFPPAEDQADREFPPEDVRLRRTPPTAFGSGPLPLTEPRVATVFRGELPIRQQQEQPAQEGQRSIVREQKETLASDKPKLEIDKKKLILYSEILKPKFDA